MKKVRPDRYAEQVARLIMQEGCTAEEVAAAMRVTVAQVNEWLANRADRTRETWSPDLNQLRALYQSVDHLQHGYAEAERLDHLDSAENDLLEVAEDRHFALELPSATPLARYYLIRHARDKQTHFARLALLAGNRKESLLAVVDRLRERFPLLMTYCEMSERDTFTVETVEQMGYVHAMAAVQDVGHGKSMLDKLRVLAALQMEDVEIARAISEERTRGADGRFGQVDMLLLLAADQIMCVGDVETPVQNVPRVRTATVDQNTEKRFRIAASAYIRVLAKFPADEDPTWEVLHNYLLNHPTPEYPSREDVPAKVTWERYAGQGVKKDQI